MKYLVTPPSSLLIHKAICGKQECLYNDLNSDFLNPQVSEENELCYGEYDAVCFPNCGFSNTAGTSTIVLLIKY